MSNFEGGTVIHGTLLSSDLLPAFLGELEGSGPFGPDEFHEERMVRQAHAFLEANSADSLDYGDAANEASEWIADLMDAVSARAPEGFYFGAIEGDGSDFGYWRVEAE